MGESSAASTEGDGRVLQGEGTRPSRRSKVRGVRARRVCRTAYLAHLHIQDRFLKVESIGVVQVWYRCGTGVVEAPKAQPRWARHPISGMLSRRELQTCPATLLPRNRTKSARNGVSHPPGCCILMSVASFRRRIGPGLGGGESGRLEVPNVFGYLYPSAVAL